MTTEIAVDQNTMIDKLVDVSHRSVASNNGWEAVCAIIYADILTMKRLFDSASFSGEDNDINGNILSTSPTPVGTDAKSLVEAARKVMLQNVSENAKSLFEPQLVSIAHLEGVEIPQGTDDLTKIVNDRTHGHNGHNLRITKQVESRIHARAAITLAEAKAEKHDIKGAVRLSDEAAFEATSISYSLNYGDWQLDGHQIRSILAHDAIINHNIDEGKAATREALTSQLEGLTEMAPVEWVIS